jgi:hypothetical protein
MLVTAVRPATSHTAIVMSFSSDFNGRAEMFQVVADVSVAKPVVV